MKVTQPRTPPWIAIVIGVILWFAVWAAYGYLVGAR
jgi:hypothetical protein